MGSGSKSSKALGRARQRQNTYSNNLDDYSDVDSRTTAMSDEDKRIVDGANGNRHFGYFQTWNAFELNEALRDSFDNGYSVQEAFKELHPSWIDEDINREMLTINTMDKNMKPTNKDMNVVRMTDGMYIERVLKDAVVNGDMTANTMYNIQNFAEGISKSISDSDMKSLRDVLLGATIHENAFASTTYNTSLSDSAFSGRRVKLDMKVNAGTMGMFSPTGQESEFVLSRNESYKVSDIYIENGKLILKTSTR